MSNPNPSARKANDYYGYTVVRDGTRNYPDWVLRLGKTVDDGWKRLSEVQKISNRPMFDVYDDNLDKVRTARTGDAGRFLLPDARNKLRPQIKIVTRNLGVNPVSGNGNSWFTVDRKATADGARRKGVANYQKLIQNFNKNYYGKSQPANTHHNVMVKFKMVDDRRAACR
jgi:hypothetical protein